MKENTNYPPAVEDALTEWGAVLVEELAQEGFPHKHIWQASRLVMGPLLLQEWLGIGSSDPEAFSRVANTATMLSLVELGLFDSMPDAGGEEVYWLTPRGKLVANLLEQQEKDQQTTKIHETI